jgi:Phage tail tube protein
MARPAIVKGTYVDILVGNGATPEVFTAVCGLTTRSFTHQVNTSDQFVRDCADPEDVPHRRLTVTGEQWDLSGEGLYNRAQAAVIRAAVGVTRNYRFVVSEPAGETVEDGFYEGPAMLTNLQLGGSDGEFGSISVQVASDGGWAWEAAV